MRDRKFGFVGILALLVLSVTISSVLAAVTSDTDTATVDITVANKTIIDISPNAVSWSSVDPGSVSSANTTFDLENLGSKPIDTIEADITTLPTSNPFGTGTATNYNAGNYLVLEADFTAPTTDPNVTAPNDMNFVRHRNFNESDDLPRYITEADSASDFEGRFRFDNEEFFFEVVPDGSYWGNGTLYIGNNPHNDTDLGSVDLSGAAATSYTLTFATGSTTDGLVDVTIATEGRDSADKYCALVNTSATNAHIDLFRWAPSLDTPSACSNDQYITTGSPYLDPGESKGINLAVRVAYGVKDGSLEQGTLQITATSQY